MNTFGERLLDALKSLFSSKKVLTMLAGLLVYLAAKRGIVLSPDDTTAILTFFSILVGAQGVADFGKGKAEVEAKLGKPPDTVAIGQAETVNLPPRDPRPLPSTRPDQGGNVRG
jgi:hypothetical protein